MKDNINQNQVGKYEFNNSRNLGTTIDIVSTKSRPYTV